MPAHSFAEGGSFAFKVAEGLALYAGSRGHHTPKAPSYDPGVGDLPYYPDIPLGGFIHCQGQDVSPFLHLPEIPAGWQAQEQEEAEGEEKALHFISSLVFFYFPVGVPALGLAAGG